MSKSTLSLVISTDSPDDSITDAQRALLTQLFHRHQNALRRHLTRMIGSPEDAAELVQETYLRLLKHAPTLSFESVSKAYIFQIGTNLAKDHFRRQRWRAHESLEALPDDSLPEGDGSPEQHTFWSQMVESLADVLRAMPPDMRTVFLRARLENCSYVDIAGELGISVRSVERRMAQAMKLLTARLEQL